MIDPHVHLRDWDHAHKETVEHGIDVAYRAGLDGIFEMPNTSPPLTTKQRILDRVKLADGAIEKLGLTGRFFHGIYGGITKDPEQIKAIVRAHAELFPRIVGLKMFAGHSTGNMGIIDEEEQRMVYRTLAEAGYEGVLAVHCEKEKHMIASAWDHKRPHTHTRARPPEAEIESVKDQLRFAREEGFKGTLHICHISTPQSVALLEREDHLNVVCGITPHHAMLAAEDMDEIRGHLLKMNPPLRPREIQQALQSASPVGCRPNGSFLAHHGATARCRLPRSWQAEWSVADAPGS